jgi:hypothetical protein
MSLPDTLDGAGLARLLHLSEATVLRDVSRRPDSLPPFIMVRKKKIWITLVVLDWLSKKSSRPIDVDLKALLVPRQNVAPALPSWEEMLGAHGGKS